MLFRSPPAVTSGIRLGTPAVTTRGMGPTEMVQIARWVVKVLSNYGDQAVYRQVRAEVFELATRFPVPGVPIPARTPGAVPAADG